MPWLNRSPLEYQVNTEPSFRRWEDTRAPTNADYKQFKVGDHWLDTSAREWWIMVYRDSTMGQWLGMAGAGAVETLTGDIGAAVGPDGAENIYLYGNTGTYLNGILFMGDPANNTMSARDLRNITKYVVDPTALETEYTTIQSALDAANAAGGDALVYIRNGTYTENLTMYDGVDIEGDNEQATIIVGTHTLPTIGTFNAHRLTFQSATDIFAQADAGTSTIIIEDCTFTVTNGYVFNIPNWLGTIAVFDIGSTGGTNDGVINNTAGATVFFTGATLGNGAVNPMIVSGPMNLENIHLQCPLNITSTAIADISMGCWFDNTITTSDTAIATIFNSSINSGANQAITHNSTNTLILSTSTIDSTNVPAIGGTGTIDVTGVDFINDATFAGTLTLTGGKSISDTARLFARTQDRIAYYSAGGEVDEMGAMLDGQLIIGSTGATPGIANLASAGGTIVITNGPGTINLETGGMVALQFTAEDATTCAPALGNLNIVGTATNGINTTAAGSTMTIGMASPYSDGDFTFTTAIAGATRTLTASNTDNTDIASHAQVSVETGGAAAGDPYVHFEVLAAIEYSLGIDNSVAGDPFKLTDGASPSAGTTYALLDIPASRWEFPINIILQEIANIGGGVQNYISNTDNTNAASDAFFKAQAGGTSGGDAYINFDIPTAGEWSFGIDNSSTTDLLIITDGASPSVGNTWFRMGNNGVKDFIGLFDGAGPGAIGHSTIRIIDETIGGNVGVLIENTDDTDTDSDAGINIMIGGESAGDPFISFAKIIGTFYVMGVDNSDSNKFKFNQGGSRPSVGITLVEITSTGAFSIIADNADITRDTGGAGTVSLTTANTDNTAAASNAANIISVGGSTSTGDPYLNLLVTGSTQYSLGIDNSDSDYLKLTDGASPSIGTELIVLNSSVSFTLYTQLFNHEYSAAPGYVYNSIYNSAAAASNNHAALLITNESTSTGDPFLIWNTFTSGTPIYATQTTMGIDNSDSDALKIGIDQAVAVGTLKTPSTATNVWKMTTAGERTMPLQPAFLGQLDTTDSNVTGDNTDFTLGSGNAFTEIFDQNADFNTNGTFTAPVTGRCYLFTQVTLFDFTASHTSMYGRIVTSNRNYVFSLNNPTAMDRADTYLSVGGSCIADMDAADTAQVKVQVSNGTKVVDVSNTFPSKFGGALIC